MMSVAWPDHRLTHDRSLERMLANLEERGIDDRTVLAAMTVVPREEFLAFFGQPYEVAHRVQALQLVGDEHVLAAGLGSGYEIAVLSLLSSHVYGIDPDPERSSEARARLVAIGYDGFSIACRDAEQGWAEHAPYDAILVAEPASELPPALIEQLAIGGRLVMVLGGRLVRATKTMDGAMAVTDLGPASRAEGN